MRASTAQLFVLLLAGLLPACGGGSGEKTYLLKTVMLEVEAERAALERSLSGKGGREAVDAVLAIQKWLDDSAVDRYLDRKDIRGTRADFERFKAQFAPSIERMLEAARSDDLAAARAEFSRFESGCNACHAVFRPDLALR